MLFTLFSKLVVQFGMSSHAHRCNAHHALTVKSRERKTCLSHAFSSKEHGLVFHFYSHRGQQDGLAQT
uniref:Uncharacterized protein n=1 Tax=Anguilla anguilla TaxID=7936 RepID=A0A0E9SWI5_ANGAN